ncbi:MAG: hypothetical protein GC154_11890 [bacterium]|nr:hypothetical protein [bacterium]
MVTDPNFYYQLSLGVALFAFGWVLFRFGMNAVGFLLGFLFGYSFYNLLQSILPVFEMDPAQYMPDNIYVIVLFSIVFGVIGVLLVKRMFRVMVFVGVLAGLMYVLYTDESQMALLRGFFAQVGLLEPLDKTLGNVWPAAFALLGALLFLYLEKHVVILLTACTGAYLIANALAPILFLPLCFIGFFIQQKQRPLRRAPE